MQKILPETRLCRKITGMLLEFTDADVIDMINNPAILEERVTGIYAALLRHSGVHY